MITLTHPNGKVTTHEDFESAGEAIHCEMEQDGFYKELYSSTFEEFKQVFHNEWARMVGLDMMVTIFAKELGYGIDY